MYSLRLREMVVNAKRTPVCWGHPFLTPSKGEPLSRNCSYNCTKVNACHCRCQTGRTITLSVAAGQTHSNEWLRMYARTNIYIRILVNDELAKSITQRRRKFVFPFFPFFTGHNKANGLNLKRGSNTLCHWLRIENVFVARVQTFLGQRDFIATYASCLCRY